MSREAYLMDMWGKFDTKGVIIPGLTDEHGKVAKKTKWTHPYSYDPIVRYYSGGKAEDSAYHDRMEEWDLKKYHSLFDRHFRQPNSPRFIEDAKATQAFLREYFDKPNLELVMIVEYCNIATGYACFRFDWNTGEK